MTRPASTRGLVYTTSTFSESTIAGKDTCFIPKSKNRSNQQDCDELRLNATVSIRELVTVDHTGNNYQGWFTIDAFDPNKNPVGHVEGEITGERITADQ
jgi:hypothetical protein